jgi:gluconolactonase
MMRFYCIALLFIFSFAPGHANAPADSIVERIATGFRFVEGPVWRDGVGLLFSDIHANKIYRWTQQTNTTVFLNHSDSSNGLTYDSQGRLILTQMQLRRVARRDTNGTITPLATNYGGKRFNSPNDLVVRSDGSVWFTDPPFNVPQGEQRELSFAGIFRINPSGSVQLLDSSLNLPNGICFSNDESKLYVNNSQAHIIYVWDIVNDSTIANKRVFATIPVNNYADGMKFDEYGNLFCTCGPAIWIYRPNGTLLDSMRVPETTSNCNWGDADRKTLFITAGTSVYRVRLATSDVKDRGSLHPAPFELYPNYPNPFNPTTNISFHLASRAVASLKIFDSLGKDVSTLVSEELPAGSYTRQWDAKGIASGVYYYRLQSGEFVQTKKLLLLR